MTQPTSITQPANQPGRASYGIDAPYAAAGVGALVVSEIVAAIISGKLSTFVAVLFLLAIVAWCLYTTRRGKFVVWAGLLDQLNLRGDERVLDLGCEEAVRVLRPGGRLLVADIRATRHHQAQLARMGMNNLTRTRLGWRFWWGGPWAATRLFTATKPGGAF